MKLKGTLVEKEMNGENAEQPIPLPECACVKENRLMRIYGSTAYEAGTKKNRKNKKLLTKDTIVLRLTRKYNNGDLICREYAEAFVKTLPRKQTTSL